MPRKTWIKRMDLFVMANGLIEAKCCDPIADRDVRLKHGN
jgi:hypothetical protein